MSVKKKSMLVRGWGINDSIEQTHRYAMVDGKRVCIWQCPYYSKWAGMINRCYSKKYQKKYPTYSGCTISEDWRYFSKFKEWVDKQPNKDWENCQLDKDFLSEDVKHYSADTCVFISEQLNYFIKENKNGRGAYMIGVSFSPKRKKPYKTLCRNPFTKRSEYLGYYSTEMEAHLVWQAKKHEHSCNLAKLQKDPHIIKVLLEKYAPDKDWTKA